jgi:hypothetical protein
MALVHSGSHTRKFSPKIVHNLSMRPEKCSPAQSLGRKVLKNIGLIISQLGAPNYKACLGRPRFGSVLLPTYQLTNQPINQAIYLPTYLPTHLPTYIPTHPPTYLPTYLTQSHSLTHSLTHSIKWSPSNTKGACTHTGKTGTGSGSGAGCNVNKWMFSHAAGPAELPVRQISVPDLKSTSRAPGRRPAYQC